MYAYQIVFYSVALGLISLLIFHYSGSFWAWAKKTFSSAHKLFDLSPLPILVFDERSWIFLAVNQAAIEEFGYTRSEFETMSLQDVRIESEIIEMHKLHLNNGGRFTSYIRYRRKNGSIFYADVHIQQITLYGVQARIFIVRDITDQYDLEQEQKLLSLAIEQANVSVVISDRNGLIRYVNPAFTKIMGYTKEEVVGKSPSELHQKTSAKANYQVPWEQIRSGVTWRGQLNKTNKTGDTVWLNASISPLRNIKGEATHFVTVEEDVTYRRYNDLIYRSIVDSSLDGFIATDESNYIIDWNPQAERIFGYKKDSVIGWHLTEAIIPSRFAAEHDANLEKAISNFKETGSTSSRARLTLKRQDGSEFPAEMQVTIVNIDGHYRLAKFFRDLTDVLNAETQLIQAKKMEAIGQLTGGLAHDFNNMLSIIVGSLDLLNDAIESEQDKALLKAAHNAAERGIEVTKSLLSVARRKAISPQIVDAHHMLGELFPLIKQSAGKNVLTEVKLNANRSLVEVEPSGFNMAILNIALNARDAMPNGGMLSIESNIIDIQEANPSFHDLSAGRYFSLIMSDTGEGMPKDIQDQAFNPLFTTKERGKGTGFGLAMVYSFAKQSGGTAYIESNLGKGTSIHILLPLYSKASTENTDIPLAPNTSLLPKGRGKLLLVDDETDLLRIGHDWLTNLGYTVTTARSSAIALEHLANGQFDLMLSDIVMPGGMDGLELASCVSTQYPHIAILLYSGYAENPFPQHAPRWRVLEKPVSKEKLAVAIALALGRKSQHL